MDPTLRSDDRGGSLFSICKKMEQIDRKIEEKDSIEAEVLWQGLVKLRDGLLSEEKSHIDREIFHQAFESGVTTNTPTHPDHPSLTPPRTTPPCLPPNTLSLCVYRGERAPRR